MEQGQSRGGGEEAKKREKTHKSCRRYVGNRGDLGRKRKKCRQERVDLVAANPDNLEIERKQGGEHKVFVINH